MSTGSVHPQGRYRRGLMFPDDVELAHDRPALDGAAPNLSILEPTGNVAPLDERDSTPPSFPATSRQGWRAAADAAIIFHPEAIPAACRRIKQRLEELNVRRVPPVEWVTQQRAVYERIRNQEEQSVRLVGVALPRAPVGPRFVIPEGWGLSFEGIRQPEHPELLVIGTPLLILRRLLAEDDSEWVELAWIRDTQWQRRIVSRRALASAEKLLELSSFGLPVNSGNARRLVQYLADFESANLAYLPIGQITTRLGWQGEGGGFGFLWGRALVTQHSDTACDAVPPPVVFRGVSEGDEQLADAFHSAGEFRVCLFGSTAPGNPGLAELRGRFRQRDESRKKHGASPSRELLGHCGRANSGRRAIPGKCHGNLERDADVD